MNIKAQKAAGTNLPVEQKVSWIDRLIIWTDHLPWPGWLFYIALLVVSELLFNVAFWIDGSVPFWKYVTL